MKIEKRINFIAIILCFVLLLSDFFAIESYVSATTSSNGSVSVTVSKEEIYVGDKFTVSITLESKHSIYGLCVAVNYDPLILKYISGVAVGNNGALKIVEAPSGETKATYSLVFEAISNGEVTIKAIDAVIATIGESGSKEIALGGNFVCATINPLDKTEFDGIYWRYDEENKELVLSGEGAIKNVSENYLDVPWYEYRGEIKTLIIEEGITSIGDNVFSKMTSLKSVLLPKTLNEIGVAAFSDCPLLEKINLNENIKEISKKTFYNCRNLKEIDCSYIISFGDYAFYRCSNLTKVSFNMAKHIGNFSFFACESLSEINFFDGLLHLGEKSFADCSNLEKVNIPSNIVYKDETAFDGCELLKAENDLNFDGLINSLDLTILKKSVLSDKSSNNDINKDGYVDIRDIVRMKKIIIS